MFIPSPKDSGVSFSTTTKIIAPAAKLNALVKVAKIYNSGTHYLCGRFYSIMGN
jgi:hypothetical protein